MLLRNNNFIFINASIQHGIRLLRFPHILRSIICLLSPYVIANSFAGLRANNLKPGKRRYVSYNGIEAKFMNKLAKNEIENLRNELIPGYLKKPGFVYISVANFVPYKDYYTVLKALAQLKYKFPFYYFILGEGPMRKEIVNTVKNFDLENQIFLIGNTENVSDYLFASDIMIHSSRGEGISNAILEGMYAGLPVIASNVGGIPETVYPGSSLLFPYKNDQVLYKCLLKSHELKASFDPQSEGYQDHLEKFSVTNMVKNFEKILETVLREER
jgi:glycosyltransferase involved in cell wall biosynthesis